MKVSNSKDRYIQVMQAALEAYGEERVLCLYEKAKKEGITEQGFPRLVSDLVILVCHGKNLHLAPLAVEMFEFCCRKMPETVKASSDFSVKELIFALKESETCGLLSPDVISDCRLNLSKFNPYVNYDRVCTSPEDKMNNWAAYNCASEFMREKAGLCSSEAFLKLQLPSQLRVFDKNGMYRDPHNPILYDLASRVQLAVLLWAGYDGEFRREIEENLEKSEELTLEMLSVNGEIPFGGRSNQFLFNEAYYAAICEFYASYENRRGNKEKAGRFKAAAALACDSILFGLSDGNYSHIRNCFPRDSKFGCESYAYFDKYMISLASFIYIAYLFSDDTVESSKGHFVSPEYASRLGGDFHKLFLRKDDVFLEFDLAADCRYDASGLGRVHCQGFPSALCLSVPFPGAEAKYVTEPQNREALCLCATKTLDGGSPSEYTVVSETCDGEKAAVVLRPDTGEWSETYTVQNGDVKIHCESADGSDIYYHLPLFDFDGRQHTEITQNENSLDVRYEGFTCRYSSSSEIAVLPDLLANRNGLYRHAYVRGKTVDVRIRFIK